MMTEVLIITITLLPKKCVAFVCGKAKLSMARQKIGSSSGAPKNALFDESRRVQSAFSLVSNRERMDDLDYHVAN